LSFITWMIRLLSPAPDEPGFEVTERYIVRGEAADRHLFHSPAGWVEDSECAVVFIRRDAAEIKRLRLVEEGSDKITHVSVERI
jgi:hypothetical protein